MAYPPITHAHAAYPNPRHSARLSTRWSRYSQLSNEDWREGGMGEPLVRSDDFPLPLPPTTLDNAFDTSPSYTPTPTPRRSIRQSIRNSWRSSIMSSGGGDGMGKHRWSILGSSHSSSPSSTPYQTPPIAEATQPTPTIRTRKRWSNAIGSTTATFVGNVGSNWGSFAPSSSDNEEMEVQEVEQRRKKGGKRGRFLYGMAMSFGGFGAAGRVAG